MGMGITVPLGTSTIFFECFPPATTPQPDDFANHSTSSKELLFGIGFPLNFSFSFSSVDIVSPSVFYAE
jgi:hypothetical protein